MFKRYSIISAGGSAVPSAKCKVFMKTCELCLVSGVLTLYYFITQSARRVQVQEGGGALLGFLYRMPSAS